MEFKISTTVVRKHEESNERKPIEQWTDRENLQAFKHASDQITESIHVPFDTLDTSDIEPVDEWMAAVHMNVEIALLDVMDAIGLSRFAGPVIEETETIATGTESFGDSVLFIEGGFENDGSDEETVRRNIRAHSAIEPAEPPVVLVEDHQEWGMFTVEFALWPLFQEFADVELACRSVSSCDHVEFIGR